MAAKKTAKKEVAPTAKKTAAKKTAVKKTAAKKTTTAKATVEKKPLAKISPDVLARAAYLNYRRRVENSLPGDAYGDWLEAERQLKETSGA
ncbi:MAG: hypothetical protein QM627_01890 [Luteolibacter sp.]